jgi:ribosome biogenesis GTPase A
MVNFWKTVNRVIDEADILLEVLDARFIDLTRNEEIENKISVKDKKYIFVVNKSDLVGHKYLMKVKRKLGDNAVFMSAKSHSGLNILRDKIMSLARGDVVLVGVLGYPNCGKSSIINALKGRASAGASSVAGFTRGVQKISVSNKIKILDTPGVLSYRKDDEILLALIASINPGSVKDKESVVEYIIDNYNTSIRQALDIDYDVGDDEFIEHYGMKRGFLKKGGQIDIDRTCLTIIDMWQKGKIKIL